MQTLYRPESRRAPGAHAGGASRRGGTDPAAGVRPRRWARALLALGLVLLPAGVAAQTPIADAVAAFQAPAATTPAKPDRALDAATWTYVATAGADWALTAVCLELACHGEDAPSVGLFVYGVENEKKAVALGLAIDVAVVLVVREWVAPDYPTLARVLLYGLSAARVTSTTLKIADLRKNATRSGS
jgi:hypothetical protein